MFDILKYLCPCVAHLLLFNVLALEAISLICLTRLYFAYIHIWATTISFRSIVYSRVHEGMIDIPW